MIMCHERKELAKDGRSYEGQYVSDQKDGEASTCLNFLREILLSSRKFGQE